MKSSLTFSIVVPISCCTYVMVEICSKNSNIKGIYNRASKRTKKKLNRYKEKLTLVQFLKKL